MSLDRSKAPIIKSIDNISIPPYSIRQLSNGIKIVELNQGNQEVMVFEIFFKAGRSTESIKLVSRAVSSLLKEGSKSYRSEEVAAKIDYYGASIKTASNMDFIYISLHTLSKHFIHILPIISEMVYLPSFDEDEIRKFINLNIERLKEELTKNEVIAYRTLTENIFGTKHVYGYNSEIDDYKNLNPSAIFNHWDQTMGSDNCTIFVSGHITSQASQAIEYHFSTLKKSALITPYEPCLIDPHHKRISVVTANQHQASLKIGRRLFDKLHPDNAGVFLLNTILGGYFGSRLMTNIREDKGYTYDIHSSIDQMIYDGYFSISSETAPEYLEPVIDAIYNEIRQLQHVKIPKEELSMVKNYLMGNFMNLLDGPLNAMSFIKSMVLTDQNEADFNMFVDKLLHTTADDLLRLANIYLQPKDMIEVIVGPKT
jgi:predicted Zn-dependent peptidase